MSYLSIETLNLVSAERKIIETAFREHDTLKAAASVLGISRHALKRKMIKHGIEPVKNPQESQQEARP